MIELLPVFTIEPTASRFAAENSLESELDHLGAITAELVPTASCIRAELHEDPDVCGLAWISFHVEVDWYDPQRVRQARDGWYDRTAGLFSPEILANFGLEIDRRAE